MIINISKEAFGTYDFYMAKEIIEEREKAAIKALGNSQLYIRYDAINLSGWF